MTEIIKIKVTPKSIIKGKMDVRFPANIAVANFLTVTKANGTYTFGVDYTVLSPGPISDPTTAYIAIDDTTAGIYRTVSLSSLLTSGLDADLQAIAALAGTGILARTAAGAWALRTIAGTTNEITVTNGDGVAGNPTIGIASGFFSTAHTWSAAQSYTITQNAPTGWATTNASTGTGALAAYQFFNSTSAGSVGIGGTGYTGQGGFLQNRAYLYSGPTTGGISLYADGALPIDFYVNGARAGGFTSGGLLTLTAPLAAGQGGTGINALGTGVATALGVNVGSAGAFVTFNGALGTPSSGTATNITGLPIASGVSGLGTGVATFLATPSSANLRAALTDEVGAGAAYFVGGALGTPASGTATNLTGLPISTGLTGVGTGVLTALAINVGSAGAFVTLNGALGTPSSGTATNLTGLPTTGLTGTLQAAQFPALTGDVTTSAGALATTIGANKVTNAMRSTMGAYTFKGNNSGSTANEGDVDIALLTTKASPAAGDYVMLSDQAASGAWKKATVSSISSAGSVSSIAGNTGAFTLGAGLTNLVNDLRVSLSTLTNTLGADVALSSTGSYFAGPTVAQGSTGTWIAIGSVVCQDSTAQTFYAKLWDGTTVAASGAESTGVANGNACFTLVGVFTSPAGNIRIDCREPFATTGSMKFNSSGNSKDCTLTVIRIA